MQCIMRIGLVMLLLIVSGVVQVLAQESCPAIARNALELTEQLCAQTGQNELCYGNSLIEAQPRADTPDFKFSAPGDIVDVFNLLSLRSHPLDVENNVWGVSMLRVQANAPGALPGQLVNFLLFGDVELRNPAAESINLLGSPAGSLNIRSGPSTSDSIVGSLAAGQEVTVIGRLGDSSWLRIVLPDDETRAAWVFASLLTVEGDTDALSVVEPGGDTAAGLNAMYFRTGLGDAQCDEAPNSGIMVQTPEGVGEISLNLNEVNISLGSTVFLQASDELRINVLEGHARVESFGVEQEARSNMRICVPLNDDLSAAGPPSPPETCNPDDLHGIALENYPTDCEHILILIDQDCPVTIPSGMIIDFNNGFGYNNQAQAEADYRPDAASIVIDNVTVADNVGPIRQGEGPTWSFEITYEWRDPQPGEHLVLGLGPHGSNAGRGDTRICEVTILP